MFGTVTRNTCSSSAHLHRSLSVDQTVSFPDIMLCVSQSVDMICVQIMWNRIAWVNFIWFILFSFWCYLIRRKDIKELFSPYPLAFRACSLVERISCGYILPRECLSHFGEWFTWCMSISVTLSCVLLRVGISHYCDWLPLCWVVLFRCWLSQLSMTVLLVLVCLN